MLIHSCLSAKAIHWEVTSVLTLGYNSPRELLGQQAPLLDGAGPISSPRDAKLHEGTGLAGPPQPRNPKAQTHIQHKGGAHEMDSVHGYLNEWTKR